MKAATVNTKDSVSKITIYFYTNEEDINVFSVLLLGKKVQEFTG